jgi:hypothetical protein
LFGKLVLDVWLNVSSYTYPYSKTKVSEELGLSVVVQHKMLDKRLAFCYSILMAISHVRTHHNEGLSVVHDDREFFGRNTSPTPPARQRISQDPNKFKISKRARTFALAGALLAIPAVGAIEAKTGLISSFARTVSSHLDKDPSFTHGAGDPEIDKQRGQIVQASIGEKTCVVTIEPGEGPYTTAGRIRNTAGIYPGSLKSLVGDLEGQDPDFQPGDIVLTDDVYCDQANSDNQNNIFPGSDILNN